MLLLLLSIRICSVPDPGRECIGVPIWSRNPAKAGIIGRSRDGSSNLEGVKLFDITHTLHISGLTVYHMSL